MLIRVENIKENGLALEVSEDIESFPELLDMQQSGDVVFSEPIHSTMRAIKIHELVEVEGRLETTVRLACSRCLKEFEAPLDIPFTLTFSREVPEVSEEGEEVELSAEEMGLIPFEGEEIDMRSPLQEQVVMALPVRPLCREVCKGLCRECGSDLNEGECGCVQPVFNQKFSALKGFRVDDSDKNK